MTDGRADPEGTRGGTATGGTHRLLEAGKLRLEAAQNRLQRQLQSPDTRVALVIGLTVYLFANNFGLFADSQPFFQHLGGEYYNIALALTSGRGYSDPFGEVTGPTAWMPPLFPAMLAVLQTSLHTRALVADVVVLLSIVSYTCVGLAVYSLAKRHQTRLSPRWAVTLYLAWLWAFHHDVFMLTHDIWLLMLLVGVATWNISHIGSGRELNPWTWGLFGGVAGLASPSLLFAWLAVSVARAAQAKPQRRRLLLAAAIAVTCLVPWAIRNSLEFQRFVPVKSNLMFEAHQANYADDDGIYDGTFKDHPFVSVSSRFEYSRLGEIAYIDKHRNEFLKLLLSDPGRYLRSTAKRLAAVTVLHVPAKDAVESGTKRVMQQLIYMLPALGLLGALWVRGPNSSTVRLLGVFWAAYLVPYIFVAFYMRYMMPLTPVLVFLAFLGMDALARRFVPARAGAPSTSPA